MRKSSILVLNVNIKLQHREVLRDTLDLSMTAALMQSPEFNIDCFIINKIFVSLLLLCDQCHYISCSVPGSSCSRSRWYQYSDAVVLVVAST